MATMYPRSLLVDEVKSDAEVLVYELLRERLADSWEVFHSVGWVLRDHGTGADDGEIDFVLAHPDEGIVCLEVKGGKLDCLRGEWRRLRGGRWERARDPFTQALDHKHALIRLIDTVDGWRGRDLLLGQALALPAVTNHSLDLAPDAPRELLLDANDVRTIDEAVERVLAYHRGQRERRRPPGEEGMAMLRDLLAPTIELEATMAASFAEEERRLIELTRDQSIALRGLRRNRHVAVLGCAGSGKTLLAVEHAKRLVAEGKRVLFVCFNAALAKSLAAQHGSDALEIRTFHALCTYYVRRLEIEAPTYPRGETPPDYWNEELPEAFLEALAHEEGPRWDALVIDEAQDLRPEWLDLLREGLVDQRESPMWLFLDDNQRIYDVDFTVPDGFLYQELTTNCRTTRAIHQQLLELHSAPYEPDVRGPEGRPPELVHAEDGPSAVAEVLDRLTTQEGVRPGDIMVLSAHGSKSAVLDRLGRRLWLEGSRGRRPAEAVRFSSIRAFKGLEAPVIVLCELEDLDEATRDRQLYVGLSRARNHCVIVAPPAVS